MGESVSDLRTLRRAGYLPSLSCGRQAAGGLSILHDGLYEHPAAASALGGEREGAGATEWAEAVIR